MVTIAKGYIFGLKILVDSEETTLIFGFGIIWVYLYI